MREKLLALSELQKIDVDIAQLRKGADSYPKQLAELEGQLATVKSALEGERAKLIDLERQRTELEQQLGEDKDKVRKWEARLTEQRSTREYSALAREIDIAKKGQLTMAEDSQALSKTQIVQREVVKKKEEDYLARVAELGGKMTELRGKVTETENAVKALEATRGAAEVKVDAGLLRRYDALRKKRMPAMVAVVAPGTCQGCRMNVPPQMYNTLRVTAGIDICPSCQRIIHAAEVLAAE